jgi:hypothetical protein
VWSTYLGGSYGDESHDVALDSQGNIYLTGWTVSTNFPTLNPFQPSRGDVSGDAFVTKMNPSGTGIIYSTYLGGGNPPGPGEDNGQGIVVDALGYAYVTGYTQSPNFPTTPGSFQPFFRGYNDAFVSKLTPAGNALSYSTFVGGSLNSPYGDDEGFDIAVDGAGQAHITGKTNSPDFPVVNAVQPQLAEVYDAFVTKLNASGSALVYSTFLGGGWAPPYQNGNDAGTTILIDGAGNAVIGGGTASYNFPVVNAYQYEIAGWGDGFISKISGSNPVPTSTTTAVASNTPTATPTATSSPTPANVLMGHLTIQGISQPSVRNNGVTLTLILCVGGVPQSQIGTLDETGTFTITTGLPNGSYTYSIKWARGLANAGTLSLSGGASSHEFGTLRGGDANNNNIINSIDFSLLRNAFGTGNNPAADFNLDMVTNSLDFNILRSTFGVTGGSLACP